MVGWEKKCGRDVDDPVGFFIEKVVVMVFLYEALLTVLIVEFAFADSGCIVEVLVLQQTFEIDLYHVVLHSHQLLASSLDLLRTL